MELGGAGVGHRGGRASATYARGDPSQPAASTAEAATVAAVCIAGTASGAAIREAVFLGARFGILEAVCA